MSRRLVRSCIPDELWPARVRGIPSAVFNTTPLFLKITEGMKLTEDDIWRVERQHDCLDLAILLPLLLLLLPICTSHSLEGLDIIYIFFAFPPQRKLNRIQAQSRLLCFISAFSNWLALLLSHFNLISGLSFKSTSSFQAAPWIIILANVKKTYLVRVMASMQLCHLCKMFPKTPLIPIFSNHHHITCMEILLVRRLWERYVQLIPSLSAQVKCPWAPLVGYNCHVLTINRAIWKDIPKPTECRERWITSNLWESYSFSSSRISSEFKPAFLRDDGLEELWTW